MLDEFPISAYPEATPGTPTTENSKYTSNNKTAVIPAGYTVDATQNSIDNGLVISKDDGWTMSGTDVKTKYKSNSRTDVKSDLTRVTPGDTSGHREPDVLNNDSYDKNTTNLSAAGLGSNISEMATNLRNDYKAMMDSVKKNGGFYIGRYELSSAGTKKNQASLTNTNWYNLYAACKASSLGASSVETRMIWGCQWDAVCNFIHNSGDQVSLTNSTSYGNYKNSTVVGHGSKKVTGYSESWKANNIYDLAGNCLEWTQEANYANNRAYRGGSYNSNGVSFPVTSRGSNVNPTYTDHYLSSRPVLYIK